MQYLLCDLCVYDVSVYVCLCEGEGMILGISPWLPSCLRQGLFLLLTMTYARLAGMGVSEDAFISASHLIIY